MSDNTNLTNAVNKLVEQLKKQYSSDGGSAGGSRKNRGQTNFDSSLDDVSGSLDDLRKELDDAADTAKHSTKSHAELIKMIDKGTSNTGKRLSELGDAFKRQQEEVGKFGKFFSEMHKSAIFKKVKGSTHLGSTINSIHDIGKEAGVAHKHLQKYGQVLQKYDVKRLSEIKNKTDRATAIDALRDLHPKLNLRDEAKKLMASNPKLKHSDAMNLAIKNTLEQFDSAADESKNLSKSFAEAGGSASKLAKGFGIVSLSFFGLLEVIKAIKPVVEEYQNMMIKGISGSGSTFFNLQKQSIILGTSFNDLTQGLSENYNIVARGGIDSTVGLLKNNQFGLLRTEGTTSAANAATLGMAQNAYLAGVNPRNQIAIQRSIDQQIDQYHTLKAATGESIAALAKQTAAILNSSDSIDLMVGMSKEQRLQYGQEILAEQTRLHLMGMTDEATQAFINTMNQGNKSKAVDKIQAAIKAQAFGNMMGIDSGLSSRYASAIRKGRGAQTPEDRQAIIDWSKAMKSAEGKMAMLGGNSEIYENAVEDNLGSINQNNVNAAAEATLGRDLTPEEIAARKKEQTASTGLTKTSSWLQKIYSVLDNSILTTLKNLLEITAIGFAVGKLGGMLSKGVGKYLTRGAVTAAGEAAVGAGAGETGIVAGGAGLGAIALPLLGAAAGGVGATYIGDKAMNAMGVKQHSLWRVLGDAGTGAAGGALAGSFVPGLGTAIGAAAGGVYGLGKGLVDYFSSSDSDPTTGANATESLADRHHRLYPWDPGSPTAKDYEYGPQKFGGPDGNSFTMYGWHKKKNIDTSNLVGDPTKQSSTSLLSEIADGIEKLIGINQKHLDVATDMANDTSSTADTVNGNKISSQIPTAITFNNYPMY